VRTCKHPRRITADYSGKHGCHGKRGLVIVNGQGRVCWVCPRLFAGRHADIPVPRSGTWPAQGVTSRGDTCATTWKPWWTEVSLHWRRRSQT
jgi:hypothetical protein